MEIKKLEPTDVVHFKQLITIFQKVFEIEDLQMQNDEYLEKLLLKPDFFALVALQNKKVVGGLSVYLLQRYYSSKKEAYIFDVGVHPEYQRKGIGKALISHLIRYCKTQEIESAYVEAEADDEQAVNFYRKTPFNDEIQATHFTYRW
jgi:aminoglycoside 3-N-acetyltransferase I